MAEPEGAPDPLIGRLLGQKFKIGRLLGAGAMGRVYAAEQTNLGKQIALKVLHASHANDAQLAKRFYREAKSASMLAHPNILQIIDFGDDDGLLFIAMELLSGRDLYRAINSERPFSTERIGHICGQILSALDEAHAKGVVHRDLKPANVMLLDVRGEEDFVKVCDFGIAKIASERDADGTAITEAGMICGTPEYMSPEQARGEPLDGRADIYSAATILYQMVVGEVPFRAESALGVITKQLHVQPTPPLERAPNAQCPPALQAVILKGLAKSRDDRFASASEMRLALMDAVGMRRPSSGGAASSSGVVAHVGGGAVSEAAVAATGVATPVSAPAMLPALSQVATTPASRGRGVLVIGVVAALGLAGAAALVIRRDNPPHPVIVESPPVAPPAVVPPVVPPVVAPPSVAVPLPIAPPTPPALVVAAAPSHKHEHHASAVKSTTVVAAAGPTANHDTAGAPAAPVAVKAAPVAAKSASSPFADGEQLFRNGDVEGALARYQEAARQNPGDAKAQRQIGKCYNRLGQRDRALPYFKRYLELAPDASDATFVRAMLDGK